MGSPARRYVVLVLGLAGLMIAAIGLLNYQVDPYNRFGKNRLGVYISSEREFKSVEVQRYPHDALLLGNSRIGIVPVDQLQGFRFFNGAFAHASPEELYYFINRFVHQQKLVILGVDMGEGDPSELAGDIFAPKGWKDALDNLLNVRTVEYSFRTIFEHWAGHPPDLYADGSSDTTRWFRAHDWDDPGYLAWELERMKKSARSFEAPPAGRMKFYQKIAAILRERGVTCIVVVPPVHAEVAPFFPSEPCQAWRRELDTVFSHVVDLSHSQYGAGTNYFKRDPAHFKPDAGVRMINAEVIPVALRLIKTNVNNPTRP